MHARVEVFQIEELVESANDRIAERGRSFFELLDAESLQRPKGQGTLQERWSPVDGHCSYQQNKKQEPEPEPGVEPELFTHAVIA